MALIIYPLDNTEYSAADVGSYACTRTRGVYAAEHNLEVTAAGGMQVQVSDGIAWLQVSKYWGVSVVMTEPVTLRINVSDGGKSRVDAVCLRLNKTENKPELVVRTGAASSSPVIPTIRRDSSYDEIYLGSVRVKAGAIGITSADITDLRVDERYCGLMRDGVTGIPLGGLLEQMQADFAAWYARMQADFAAWYARMRGQLDEDAAGHLQLELDAVSDRLTPDLLWENAAPDSPFPAGEIPLPPCTAYRSLRIDYLGTRLKDAAPPRCLTACMAVDGRALLTYDTTMVQYRLITIDGDSLHVSDCSVSLLDGHPAHINIKANDNLIPYKIYGIKK